MTRKYLAFDIETAKILPRRISNLKEHRPLGICCAATLAGCDDEPQLWYGQREGGSFRVQMTKRETSVLVRYLAEKMNEGFTIVTWNGLGFDFDILGEESGRWDECRRIAEAHVDMMFHVFCALGYPIGLSAACAGMGLHGKSATVQQHMAPQLWADGRNDEVLAYVAQDVRATLSLAVMCERQRLFRWISRNGAQKELRLNSGWFSVAMAMSLPEVDTSWMTNPIPRSQFTSWLQRS